MAFDFLKDIIPTGVQAATSLIPGVGPILGPIAGKAASSLLGGSSSGGGNPGQIANNDMLNMLLGFENDGTRFLENYTQNVFFDGMESFEDSDLAQDAFENVFDAVQAGNLDPFTANQFMASKLSPTSSYYGSDKFAQLLNAEVKPGTQRNLVNDAFASNFYRAPSDQESDYLVNLADSMGMNKSPMQFNSFLNSRLANSLEAERKGPLSAAEQATQAYYGRMIRTPDGSKTGTYNVFGYPQKGMSFSDTIA